MLEMKFKKIGRPATKTPRELMAFRFRQKYAALLRKIASKKGLSQVRVLEMAIDCAFKEIA